MSGFEFCTMYRTCKRCGAYHDDGTWDLCMDCLEAEEKATVAENVQVDHLRETTKMMKEIQGR